MKDGKKRLPRYVWMTNAMAGQTPLDSDHVVHNSCPGRVSANGVTGYTQPALIALNNVLDLMAGSGSGVRLSARLVGSIDQPRCKLPQKVKTVRRRPMR